MGFGAVVLTVMNTIWIVKILKLYADALFGGGGDAHMNAHTQNSNGNKKKKSSKLQ